MRLEFDPTSGDPCYADSLIGKYKNYLFSIIVVRMTCEREGDHVGEHNNIKLPTRLILKSKRNGWYFGRGASVSRKTNTLRKTRLIARWFDSYRISTSWQLLVWLWQPIWVSHYEWSSRCRGEFATSIQRRNLSCSCVKV